MPSEDDLDLNVETALLSSESRITCSTVTSLSVPSKMLRICLSKSEAFKLSHRIILQFSNTLLRDRFCTTGHGMTEVALNQVSFPLSSASPMVSSTVASSGKGTNFGAGINRVFPKISDKGSFSQGRRIVDRFTPWCNLLPACFTLSDTCR